VLILDSTTGEDEETVKKVAETQTQVRVLIATSKPELGKIAYVASATEAVEDAETATEAEGTIRNTYLVRTSGGKGEWRAQEVEGLERIFEMLRTVAERKGRRKLAVHCTDRKSTHRVRKILERVLKDSGVQCAMYVGKDGDALKRVKTGRAQYKDVVTIKPQQGKTNSYRDILKKLQSGVRMHKVDARVGKVSRGTEGEVKITITSRKKGGCEALNSEILERCGEVAEEVTVKPASQPRRTLIVRDLDADTTAEDVQEAIEETLRTMGEVPRGWR
jgi:hypothetical protein